MKIQYVDHMGSDDTVVDAARVSFSKLAYNYADEKNMKLIKYLAKNNHWTPFAHPQITMRVKVPIFIARQYFKHIVGSVKNEVSRRYVSDKPEFYYPEWRARPAESIKQGAGDYTDSITFDAANVRYQNALSACQEAYDCLLDLNIAPEQARMILPQSMYTEFVDTGSLVYWARMYKQRSDGHAQSEWYELMEELHLVMSDLFPVSWRELTPDRGTNND